MALDVHFIPKQLEIVVLGTGSLLLFDATSTLWSSKDDGCTWSKLAKLPFGQGSEQVRRAWHGWSVAGQRLEKGP